MPLVVDVQTTAYQQHLATGVADQTWTSVLQQEDIMTTRITYKSQFGDYGINQEWENLNEFELIHLLANKLGNYEDLGTIEELKALKEATK